MAQDTGRAIYAGLKLMDRQILDCDGRMVGNVDDVELEEPPGGGPPVVVAVLSGPAALANQLRGRLGKWMKAVHRRLHPEEDPSAARIPFTIVKRVENHIELSVPREGLPSNRLEEWARDHVIAKIPGSGHAPD